MTQLQKFIALYEEVGIKLDQEKFDDDSTLLTIQAKQCDKVVGYNGFFTDLRFDKDGNFIEQGIWE